MARQNISSNLEKKSCIEKDFENVQKVIKGESIDNRTAFSKKVKEIVQATVEYSENYGLEACIRLYTLYKISPRKVPLLSERVKNLLKETFILYRRSGKTSNLFLKNYLEKIQNAHP